MFLRTLASPGLSSRAFSLVRRPHRKRIPAPLHRASRDQ